MSNNLAAKGKADEIDGLVGRHLKERRVFLGLSQQDLSKAINVSIQQIQKYEKATNRITCGKLYHLSKFLNVSISYFFGEEDAQGKKIHGVASVLESNLEAESEVIVLVRCFNSMSDKSLRRHVINVIRAMSCANTSHPYA